MKLETLTIWKEYGKDNYKATVKYSGQYGTIECALDAEQLARILPLIGSALVAASRDVATNITQSVFETIGTTMQIEDRR